MRTVSRISPLTTTAVLLCGSCILVVAQTPPAPGVSPAQQALTACARAAETGQEKEAKQIAAEAESLFHAGLKVNPDSVDPRVGLARVISECRIRFANFMSAGRLIGESNRLLEEALEIDPTHWSARYTLALNHYHTPEFLGRTDDAIRHLEILLEQQGDRTDSPVLAGTYLYLGDLYQRVGRRDEAVALWQRGVALFPDHARLRERLEKAGVASGSAPRGDGADEPASAADLNGELPSEPPTPGVAAAERGSAADDSTSTTPRYTLGTVTVRTRRHTPRATTSGMSLNRFEVLTAPGGAGDLLHGIRMHGGVTQATDGSDLYVRGGDPAEAPVWVDGGRILHAGTFETLHGGLFGVLNPAVLRDAYFSGGGFSVRYGNALSGVLDVRTDGRPAQPAASIGVNLAGGNATVRSPLGARAGVWGTGRFTDATLLVRMQGMVDEYPEMPRALEGTFGVVAEPRRGMELKATALLEGDGATRRIESHGHTGPFRSRGDTRHSVLGATLVRKDGAQLHGILSASQRESAFRFGVLDRERTDRSLSARLAGTLPFGGTATLRGGAEAAGLGTWKKGWMPETGIVAPGAPAFHSDESGDTHHLGGYVEGEISPVPALSMLAGIRMDRLPGEEVWTADPRLALALRNGGWLLRLSGGVFHQGRWRAGYAIPDAGSPSGIPRRARHLALGAEREGAVRLEAYAKEYDRYVPDGDGPPITAGRVLGADALVRWSAGERLGGWIAYSLLHGRVTLADGPSVPSRIDVTHGLTAVGKWAIGDAWELGATARLATGRPYTPVFGGTPSAEGRPITPVYGEMHSARLPEYRRLDARLTRIGALGNRRVVTFLEILNALDRRNAMGYTYNTTYRERRPVESFFARRVAMLGAEVQFR